MSERSPGPRCRWDPNILLVLVLHLSELFQPASAEKNAAYTMAQLCQKQEAFLSQIARTIDGAVLTSQNERNLNCIVTFQTETVLQKLMLRFDKLNLDCNDHLYIYEANHAYGEAKYDLSCRSSKESIGVTYTNFNYVTFKYVTDSWGLDSNGFRLVITAFKDIKHACLEYSCKNEFCISRDLTCDGVDHCDDGSDEDAQADCPDSGPLGRLLSMEVPLLAIVSASLLLVLCGSCALVLFFLVKNHRTQRARRGRGPYNSCQHPASGDKNGLTVDKATYPTTSLFNKGNMHLPAGLVGYSILQVTYH